VRGEDCPAPDMSRPGAPAAQPRLPPEDLAHQSGRRPAAAAAAARAALRAASSPGDGASGLVNGSSQGGGGAGGPAAAACGAAAGRLAASGECVLGRFGSAAWGCMLVRTRRHELCSSEGQQVPKGCR